jgi:hypothetical protein
VTLKAPSYLVASASTSSHVRGGASSSIFDGYAKLRASKSLSRGMKKTRFRPSTA